jgi:hypothetical protein
MSEENDGRKQVEQDAKEDLELEEEDAGKVGGGRAAPSPPAGPIPIPYPIVSAGDY